MQVNDLAQTGNADATQPESTGENNEVNDNETITQQGSGPLDNLTPDQLKDWGRRQAADAAKYRKKLSVEKAAREQERQTELERQGKYKEMYEQSKEQLDKLQGGIQRGMVTSQLKDELLKLGCNPQLVDKAIRHADVKEIQTDPETYKADAEQVMFEAKRVKEEVPVFFGTSFKEPKDGVPGTVVAPKKSVGEMSDAELDQAYNAALMSEFGG